MNDKNWFDFEEKVISAVKSLLENEVNALLQTVPKDIPFLEFGNWQGKNIIVPTIKMLGCEATEKERLLTINTYIMRITMLVRDEDDTTTQLHLYSTAISRVLRQSDNLGGLVDSVEKIATLIEEPPDVPLGKMRLKITIRLTVEEARRDCKWA